MIQLEIRSFTYEDFDRWCLPWDYHCLYLLENGRQVYIGETKDVIQRSKEHNRPSDFCQKFDFQRVYVITSEDFEETPAKHYEDLLIRLMRADGKFEVVNNKDGEWTHYKRKNGFEISFDRLWLQLEKIGLVNEKHFYSILNTGMYKYCPDTMNVTQQQHEALTSIMHTIDSRETYPHKDKEFLARPILLSGDAGTGKTVVATTLFYYLKTHPAYQDLKIGLVYANPSTRNVIQQVFCHTPGLRKKDVIAPIDVTKQRYDIIICDEAQRLRQAKNIGRYMKHFKAGNQRLHLDNHHDELDWLLTNTDRLILFYDPKQIVCPSDISQDKFEERLKARNRGIRPIELKEQMRICAGDQYVPYIYQVLFHKANAPKHFENYDFKLFSNFSEMWTALEEKEETVQLCRLCSGYGWEWTSKGNPEKPDIQLDGCEIWWNRQTGGWLQNPKAKKEMGSIYSLAGLDLNYTGVVIGPDLVYDPKDDKIKCNKAYYFDRKVKQGVGEEELTTFLLDTYAVLMTRGILGTYVYVCDPHLRRYLQNFIPSASPKLHEQASKTSTVFQSKPGC